MFEKKPHFSLAVKSTAVFAALSLFVGGFFGFVKQSNASENIGGVDNFDSGDYEDVESYDAAIDFKMTNVKLVSTKIQRKRSTGQVGLLFKISTTNTSVEEPTKARMGMDCAFYDSYPMTEEWQNLDFTMKPGQLYYNRTIFYEFKPVDPGFTGNKVELLRKRKPFICYVAISGLVMEGNNSTPDANTENNAAKFKVSWANGKLKQGKIKNDVLEPIPLP